MRFVAYASLSCICLMVGTGLWAFATFAEREDLPQTSLQARLMIPEVFRVTEWPGRCTTLYFGRVFIDCAGVCGTRYQVSFESSASHAELDHARITHPAIAELGVTSSQILDTQEGDCRPVRVFFNIDDRITPS